MKFRTCRVIAAAIGATAAPALAIAQSDRAAGLVDRVGVAVDRWWTASLFEIGGVAVSFASLMTLTGIVGAAYLLSVLLQRALNQFAQRPGAHGRAALYAVGRLLHYLMLAAGLMMGLAAVGLDVGKVTLLVSAVGIGLGFGLQQIINNMVSGIILLFEQSLKVGDFVELESGVTGEVREINIRSTRITTNDNLDVLVPNSAFIGGQVTNWTLREASRRVRVPFGVAYGTDKNLVRRAVLEAAAEVPFMLETDVAGRQPQVWLTGFGASSLDFELVIWVRPEAVKKPDAVRAAYNWAIESALATHGIEIPFPQNDLHLRSLFGLHAEQALSMLGRLSCPDSHDERVVPVPPAAVHRADPQSSENDAARDALADPAHTPRGKD